MTSNATHSLNQTVVVTLIVPDAVRRKAQALGAAGEHWLDELPATVGALERDWGVKVDGVFAGGSGALVAAVGADAVLKIAIPDGLRGHSPFANEVASLQAGNGPPYVRVLRADHERRAMLQERLGRRLNVLGLSVEQQIDIIARTLASGWRRVDAPGLRTGAEQAEFLIDFIRERSHGSRVADQAVEFATARRDAFDPAQSVLIHGDAHPANVLEDRNAPGEFRLIDPDGMRSEPAHDLAIPLRDWSDELLAGDPLALAWRWCTQLARRAGIDPQPIWEWAFVERVSTGLFLRELGDAYGQKLLDVASAWLSS
jgi:streptomycin 6-kinase